jgi:hypothetical protein
LRRVLVIANETIGGRALTEALERRAREGELKVTVLAPVSAPRRGYVVYDDTRRAAAGRRLDVTLERLRSAGINAHGLVVEADPVSVLRDALETQDVDEVVVATHPQQKSSWLRGNVVASLHRAAGDRPFEHVVVDLQAEQGTQNVLVVANQTVLGPALLEKIRERAAKGAASFTIVSPQGGAEGSYDEAERRLRQAVAMLRGEGLDVHGQIAHPDPYAAVRDAIEDERVDELIVSTLPGERSGWLRRDLVERLRNDTKLPVEHVVVDPAARSGSARRETHA